MNRRRFIGFASALAGFAAGRAAAARGVVKAPGPRIVAARDRDVQNARRDINPERLQTLLEKAMSAFFRTPAREAWHKVAGPEDVVGLKVNCLAGKGISTSAELVDAVIAGLAGAGVSPERIIVWDRLNRDLERAGFGINVKGPGVRCFGNDAAGYDRELTVCGEAGSLLSRTISEYCSVQINMPVLKDHGIVGMTGALKNYFGAIHNPNKFHVNRGNPYIADVYSMPKIRERTRLIICDALTCQFEGGPPFMPKYCTPYSGILIGDDPVALDRTGWDIIEEMRGGYGLPTLARAGREPSYIAVAADDDHRLGVYDAGRIEKICV